MGRLFCLSICVPFLASLGQASIITLPAGDVGAVVLFDSITGDATLGAAKLGPPETVNYTGVYASFSTGTSLFDLQDVNLALNWRAQPTGQGATVTVDLFADNTLAPGSLLDVIATTTDATIYADGLGNYYFPTNIALMPNTRYWIGVIPGGPTTSAWEATAATSGTGVVSEYSYVTSAGAVSNAGGQVQMMELSGTNTPEPSTILLAALGFGAVVLFGRRSGFRGVSK